MLRPSRRNLYRQNLSFELLSGEVAIPDRNAMMRPILTVLSDGSDHPSPLLRDAVAAQFKISRAERSLLAGNSPQARFTNEHAFALIALQHAGLIAKPDPGRYVYRITSKGRRALRDQTLPGAGSRFLQTASSAAPRKPKGLQAEAEQPLSGDYRSVAERSSRSRRDPFPFDPNELDRQTLAHARLQTRLEAAARAAGYHVHSPQGPDPDFDIAWDAAAGKTVVEIKTINTNGNEAKQIRLAMGQILDYQHRLRTAGAETTAVIVVDRQPRMTHWQELCRQHGITLCWPETIPHLFKAAA